VHRGAYINLKGDKINMILLLIIIILIGTGALLTWYATKLDSEALAGVAVAGMIIGFVIFVISTIAFLSSWMSSLDLEAQYKVFKTGSYHETVQAIEENSNLILQLPGDKLTDFAEAKQIEVYAKAISQLREDVIEYNTELAGKEAYKNSLLLNWIITMPENVKLINLREAN
jgi:hypothetical protein